MAESVSRHAGGSTQLLPPKDERVSSPHALPAPKRKLQGISDPSVGSDLLEPFEVVKMTDPLFEFRNLATRCRELAEESNIPEVRERNLKLAEILEQTVAEIESGDVLLAALEEVVRSLPCEPEAEELARSWEPLLRERH